MILPLSDLKSQCNSYQNPKSFFIKIEKANSKITKTYLDLEKPRGAKTTLKKNQLGSFTFLDFKTYYKATVTKQYGTGLRTGAYITHWVQKGMLRNKPTRIFLTRIQTKDSIQWGQFFKHECQGNGYPQAKECSWILN